MADQQLTCERHQDVEDGLTELKVSVGELKVVVESIPDKIELAVLKGIQTAKQIEKNDQSDEKKPWHQSWTTPVLLAVIAVAATLANALYKLVDYATSNPHVAKAAEAASAITKEILLK